MEILKKVSIDWLGKKWYFLVTSWLVLAAGVVGYFVHGGLKYGIDFTGGTLVLLKFNAQPDLEMIRAALKPESIGETIIQRYDEQALNKVQVRIQTVSGSEQDVDRGQREVQQLLRNAFDPAYAASDKLDFNNVGRETVAKRLQDKDPDNLKGQNKTSAEIESHYAAVASSLLDYRDKVKDGLVNTLDDLKNASGVSSAVVGLIQEEFFAGSFAVKGRESVGAVVGADLRRRATWAVGLSFLGMLVYIALRFKPIYGVAAIVALFHDLSITLGLFALTQKEISLTVIAALLTLVGYSVNDTIVIFDRVRENLRIFRKETLPEIINISINQTLSRTILTSGFTFLSVLALLLFGGEVLNGFSFALTVGIIVGTYSTVGIAGPIVELWYRSVEAKPKRKAA